MRSLSQVFSARLVCVFALSAYLAVGVVGCGGDSGPANGTAGALPAEATQANKNMEDFMKNQPKK